MAYKVRKFLEVRDINDAVYDLEEFLKDPNIIPVSLVPLPSGLLMLYEDKTRRQKRK